MVYISLYSISKGLYSTVSAMVCHISLKMGIQHWNSILCLSGNKEIVKIRILVTILLLEELEGNQ